MDKKRSCGKEDCPNTGTKHCGHCKIEFYCSPQCQKCHWVKHKLVCAAAPPKTAPAGATAAAAGGAGAAPPRQPLPEPPRKPPAAAPAGAAGAAAAAPAAAPAENSQTWRLVDVTPLHPVIILAWLSLEEGPKKVQELHKPVTVLYDTGSSASILIVHEKHRTLAEAVKLAHGFGEPSIVCEFMGGAKFICFPPVTMLVLAGGPAGEHAGGPAATPIALPVHLAFPQSKVASDAPHDLIIGLSPGAPALGRGLALRLGGSEHNPTLKFELNCEIPRTRLTPPLSPFCWEFTLRLGWKAGRKTPAVQITLPALCDTGFSGVAFPITGAAPGRAGRNLLREYLVACGQEFAYLVTIAKAAAMAGDVFGSAAVQAALRDANLPVGNMQVGNVPSVPATITHTSPGAKPVRPCPKCQQTIESRRHSCDACGADVEPLPDIGRPIHCVLNRTSGFKEAKSAPEIDWLPDFTVEIPGLGPCASIPAHELLGPPVEVDIKEGKTGVYRPLDVHLLDLEYRRYVVGAPMLCALLRAARGGADVTARGGGPALYLTRDGLGLV